MTTLGQTNKYWKVLKLSQQSRLGQTNKQILEGLKQTDTERFKSFHDNMFSWWVGGRTGTPAG